MILELPRDCRCVAVDPDAWNLPLNHCFFGMPPSRFFGTKELVKVPEGANGFNFYLGSSPIGLIRAFLESEHLLNTEDLSVGNSSFCKGSDGNYEHLVEILSDFDYTKLKLFHLGIWELFENSHCAYGYLGNVTKLLTKMPNLEELHLYGNSVLDQPQQFHKLTELTIVLDDPTTGINGGAITDATLESFLCSYFPALDDLYIDLEIENNSPEYTLPERFLSGENVPNLKKLELAGKFANGERERFLQSSLGKRDSLILHVEEFE